MLPYFSAVMPQIAYAHSVREFIRELLKRFIPGKWIDRAISNGDEAFSAALDAAFAGLDERTATEKDYCNKVVSVLCDEVAEICEVTRLVCVNRGYDEYAAKYLSSEKFIRLLLRQDTAKLKKLNAAMADASKPLCVLLREIGSVLEEKSSDEGTMFGAAEIKKANAELKAIAADVKKTIKTGFVEVKRDIAMVGEKVDAVAAKMKRGKRRGQHSDDKVSFCVACVDAAKDNTTLRNSTKTKMTLKAVYNYYRHKLASQGINDFAEFSRIVHAYRARESRARIKELETRQNEKSAG